MPYAPCYALRSTLYTLYYALCSLPIPHPPARTYLRILGVPLFLSPIFWPTGPRSRRLKFSFAWTVDRLLVYSGDYRVESCWSETGSAASLPSWGSSCCLVHIGSRKKEMRLIHQVEGRINFYYLIWKQVVMQVKVFIAGNVVIRFICVNMVARDPHYSMYRAMLASFHSMPC